MCKNIFQIWDEIGRVTPFLVRRNTWSKRTFAVIENIIIKKYPYGNAYGYLIFKCDDPESFEYKKKEDNEIISCGGCYQWTLVIKNNLKQQQSITTQNKTSKDISKKNYNIKVYKKESKLNFGKHKGKTIEDILNIEPHYLEWCINNINNFRIDDQTIKFIITQPSYNFKEETIKQNNNKIIK